MKKEIKDRWVTALRSGEYQQTKEFLATCDGFCCLGVLCDLYINEHDHPSSTRYRIWKNECEFRDTLLGVHENMVLPKEVREWSGLSSSDGAINNVECLTQMNDRGMTFSEIADVIDDKWEEL